MIQVEQSGSGYRVIGAVGTVAYTIIHLPLSGHVEVGMPYALYRRLWGYG